MEQKARAKIYMIPVPIAEGAVKTLSQEVVEVTGRLKYYFAEDAKTARRILRSIHPTLHLEPIKISEIDKHQGPDLELFRSWIKAGHEIGVMSEAGCPGIADPGAQMAVAAHSMHAEVIPLTGPNSILLALMASGLNGQSFCFRGYLPIKDPGRSKAIKDYEAVSAKEKQTQIFIETPYRNAAIVNDLLQCCRPHTRLCIAVNITGEAASIKTKSIADWRQDLPVLGKHPAVFLLLG